MKPLTTTTLLTDYWRINALQQKALTRLKIETVRDLLFHFPHRYSDIAELKSISQLDTGDDATIYGKISNLKTGKTFRTNKSMATATITDNTGSIGVKWFHQPYIIKSLKNDTLVELQGKVTGSKGKIYLANPELKRTGPLPIDTGDSLFGEKHSEIFGTPIYPESRGITTKWIYHHIQTILKQKIHLKILDPIPKHILEKYNLPSLQSALVWIHSPRNAKDAQAAKKRFAFEEIFYIQLVRQQMRQNHEEQASHSIKITDEDLQKFIATLPYKPTEAQKTSIETILKDMQRPHPMSRLLEGDVGSGKTTVAAAASYAVITHGRNNTPTPMQVAYMAPTEILAKQLFATFTEAFADLPISMGLLTGSGCQKYPSKVSPTESTSISRAQLLKWVANGEISLLIGTHALIQKKVVFNNLALVIIDEQHRFGTAQRSHLTKKDTLTPHLLSMTATPIPRTLALTIYGDLDLTLLDQMPHGRKPIITNIVEPHQRESTYTEVHKELEVGRQLYVICPRIDEPDPDKAQALNVKSVKEEAARLKNTTFSEYSIGTLHSKMTPTEKDAVMYDFLEKKIDILVATSVVEVGVNVPNATVIIIEGAERFGLSQLHQLRGRVIRSTHQAYCYIFAQTKTQKTLDRLTALKTAKNGFELAEYDLELRGAGELLGNKQWGISDIAMEAIKNIKMVEAARGEAQVFLSNPESRKNYPLLQQKLESYAENSHFE